MGHRLIIAFRLHLVKKNVTNGVTLLGKIVDVGFSNTGLARTFNEIELLRRVFGTDLACKIATRLAVLSAADNLSLVPSFPPIGLRAFGSGRVRFGVTISQTHYLMFVPLLTHGSYRRIELSRITAIEIQGVE